MLLTTQIPGVLLIPMLTLLMANRNIPTGPAAIFYPKTFLSDQAPFRVGDWYSPALAHLQAEVEGLR